MQQEGRGKHRGKNTGDTERTREGKESKHETQQDTEPRHSQRIVVELISHPKLT